MQRFLTSIFLLTAVGSLLTAPHGNTLPLGNLTVNVSGLQSQKGQICFSLFASGRGFPSSKQQAKQAGCVKIKSYPLKVTLKNLEAGNYAVALFHDLNGDGILNQNQFGMPTEKFGFSQNPTVLTGPPTFLEAAFIVIGAETNIDIHLRSLFANQPKPDGQLVGERTIAIASRSITRTPLKT
jgi:uncharacterized protein (DUF2141 family)